MTVAELAAAKRLDEQWLRGLGVGDVSGGGVSIEYLDAGGSPLFVRRRDEPGKPRFRQPRGRPLAPYGLWTLADHDTLATLFLTEGESDAWALWADGMPALGLPGSDAAGCLGAEHLAGVEALYLCGDRDAAGHRFADACAKRLAGLGFAGRVWRLTVPAPHKDVSEMRASDPAAFADAWRELRAAAVPVATAGAEPAPEPVIVRLADVEPQRVGWLWPGWMPEGCLVVLDGDPGLGKSSLTLDVAARLSRGLALPPLDGPDLGRRPAASLLLGAEDSLAHTVRPRLDAMGADASLIYSLEAIRTGEDERPVSLPRDLERVADFIARRAVKLVVIDPLMAYLGGEYDAHKDQDVRRCLRPMHKLAERLGIVVLLVRHLNKLSAGPALYRGGSSIGITGAARASLIVGRDPMGDRHVLAMNKINVGPKPKALAYRLEAAGMACKVEWDGECELRADQILGHGAPAPCGPAKLGRPASALEAAKHFLSLLLVHGPVETAEMQRRAKARGIASATLDRARADLGVVPYREGKTYFVRLPPTSDGAAAADDLPWDENHDNGTTSGEDDVTE